MRPLIMAFLILSPFIALAQNYHLQVQLPALVHAPLHFAQAMLSAADMKMAAVVHTAQELLG